MAVGDVVDGGVTSVAGSGGVLTIRPATATEEWLITNIYIPDGTTSVELYRTDGTNDILIYTMNGSLLGFNFYITYNTYLKIVNNNTNAVLVSYDGIVTKV